MIDIETQVYNAVSTALSTAHSGIWVTGEYVPVPPKFPCVMLMEMSNVPYRRTQDTTGMENHAVIMYEIDVYSNKKTGKKSECKGIAATVDGVMAGLGFTRMMLKPVPNLADSTIYRMTGRYEAIVGNDETIYRR